MSMQKIKCPHCGFSVTVSINDNVKMAATHKTCSNCKKSYTYQGVFGQVKISK